MAFDPLRAREIGVVSIMQYISAGKYSFQSRINPFHRNMTDVFKIIGLRDFNSY